MSSDDEIVIGIDKPNSPKKSKKKTNANKNQKNKNQKNKKNSKVTNNSKSKKNVRAAGSRPEKKETPKLKKPVIVFIVIVCAVGTIVVLMNIDICKIKHIELKNNSVLSVEDVKELAKFEEYTNLFSLNVAKVKKDIKQNSYVEDVEISRKFPNTVVVTVKERTPKYMIQVADSYVYINNQGYMLEISTERQEIPIILGFKTDLSNVKPGSRLDIEDLKQMEKIIKIVETANINDIGNLITKIDVSDTKNYTLILETEQKTVYLGDCSNLNTRLLYLNGILNQTRGLAGEIFLNMDLNTDDAYFREQT